HSIRQTSTETSTEFMQHFLRLVGFLGAATSTEEEQAKKFQWGLRRNSGNGRDQRKRGHQSNRSANSGTCFKCGQAGHLQKDCKKNTTTSTYGQPDKKPGASGHVFAITEGQAANTSGTITG
nr:zinc finger, CCHC-type, retrotransposon Gag domain protein [Tanacetum cinerariifolium]